MTAWVSLPIWADAAAEVDMARIRAVKDEMWLDYMVKPTSAEGSLDERCLAWGSAPPFVCAYALVDPLGTDDELMNAMAWVLHITDECPTAMDVEQVLAVILGPGTQEVPPEVLAAEAKYAAYEEERE